GGASGWLAMGRVVMVGSLAACSRWGTRAAHAASAGETNKIKRIVLILRLRRKRGHAPFYMPQIGCRKIYYSFTAPECLIASANFAISASQNFPNSAAPMKRTVRPAFS